MGIKLKDKIVLQGCKERYCEYGPCYRSLCWIYILDESYLTRLSGLMDSKAGSRAGDLRSFPRRGDLSILILWTLCQKAMVAEAECLFLLFGGLRMCYLLAGRLRWHEAKSYLGPTEIWPNMFGDCNNCL